MVYLWGWVQQKRCNPCPSARPGVAEIKGARQGGGSPTRQGKRSSQSKARLAAEEYGGSEAKDGDTVSAGRKAVPWITRGVSHLATRNEAKRRQKMGKEESVDKTAKPFVAYTGPARFASYGALRLPGPQNTTQQQFAEPSLVEED